MTASGDTATDALLFDKRGGVVTLTLNRPAARNALTDAMFLDMERILIDIEADDEVRVVVVTGAGRGFSAGADLKPVPKAERRRTQARAFPGDHGGDILDRANRCILGLQRLPKPVLASIIVMRPSAVHTRFGWRSPGDSEFDPFWARVNEAGICVVAHVASTAYTANGYGGNAALDSLGGGRKPSVAGMIPERAIYDFLVTLAYDKLFERFPNLRVASIENGSGFLGDLFVKIEQSKRRMPHYYKEDPAELFREHVWINPFWEDKIEDVVAHMGADQVIFGSDWPHMEGMEYPRQIFEELGGISLADQAKILHSNTAALNQPRMS